MIFIEVAKVELREFLMDFEA